MDVAEGGDGDVRRLLHQRQLVRRLDHSAAAHDRSTWTDLDAAHGPAEAVHREETDRLLNADRAGDTAVAQEAGDALQRILVLVPGAHVRRDLQALADRRLLEMRGDDAGFTDRGDDEGGEALAPPPLHAREIGHGRTRLDQQRADPLLRHQPLRLGEALHVLVAGDGDDVPGHRAQGLRGLALGEGPERDQGGRRRACCKEGSPVRLHALRLDRRKAAVQTRDRLIRINQSPRFQPCPARRSGLE